jgi:hypothetical protein
MWMVQMDAAEACLATNGSHLKEHRRYRWVQAPATNHTAAVHAPIE